LSALGKTSWSTSVINKKYGEVGIDAQAVRMLNLSRKKFAPAAVRDNVLISIPSVDRSRLATRNVLGVVMEHNESLDLYKIGTKDGTLAKLYAINEFQKSKTNDLLLEDVPDKTTSVRSSSAKESGSQDFTFCNCLRGCAAKSCKCRKNNLKCNSKCHNGGSCTNKLIYLSDII